MVLDFLMTEVLKDQMPVEYTVHEGSVFTAVECKDGKTGICAAMESGDNDVIRNNVVRQALINAHVNIPEKKYCDSSFIDTIPLNNNSLNVMLGFIEPVYILNLFSL